MEVVVNAHFSLRYQPLSENDLMQQAVIISATRSAIGKFQGTLKNFTAPQLGALAVRAALERAQLDPNQIDEAYP